MFGYVICPINRGAENAAAYDTLKSQKNHGQNNDNNHCLDPPQTALEDTLHETHP